VKKRRTMRLERREWKRKRISGILTSSLSGWEGVEVKRQPKEENFWGKRRSSACWPSSTQQNTNPFLSKMAGGVRAGGKGSRILGGGTCPFKLVSVHLTLINKLRLKKLFAFITAEASET